ncbi:unnamed protein product [Prunus armeniaca]
MMVRDALMRRLASRENESSAEAISDKSFRYSRRFPTRANGNQAISGTTNGRKGDSCPDDLKHSSRPFSEVELRYRSIALLFLLYIP